MRISEIPRLTWEHLDINVTALDTKVKEWKSFDYVSTESLINPDWSRAEHISEEVIAENNQLNNVKRHYVVDESAFKEANDHFELNEKNPQLIDEIAIQVKKNGEFVLTLDYSTQGEIAAYRNSLLHIYAEPYAKVTIYLLQRMNDASTSVHSIYIHEAESAKVVIKEVELGAGNNMVNFQADLVGRKSEIDIKCDYLGGGTQNISYNYVLNHYGEQTDTSLEVFGVLKDYAYKVFRGTIDFKHGSSKSKGHERETVILLDPTVHNKTTPLLLCEEEDVEGEHAASEGKLNEAMMFYIMARGLSYSEARKLIIGSKFMELLDEIPKSCLQTPVIELLYSKLEP